MTAVLDGSNCSATIMAGRTVIHDAGMIKHRIGKCARNVTDATILIGGDMARILLGHSTRGAISMTLRTVAGSTGMVEGSVSKTCGVMTDATVLCRGRVASILASGTDAGITTVMA